MVKSTGSGPRLFVLAPAPGELAAIEHKGLFVRGAFKVIRKINNPRNAFPARRKAEAEN